ncbi:MAG: hypothetical protein EOP53_15700 [Sphingobacteriales bacterium]|nr:MAG: hypothetical protein EOP53_15700 [Sphingobacteriales bacterium]
MLLPQNNPKRITKRYNNGEITVIWKPHKCIHSAKCFNGLRTVFDPIKKPWVNITGSDSEAIINQVEQCPSSALTYVRNDEAKKQKQLRTSRKVEVLPNGPLIVYGNLLLSHNAGNETQLTEKTAFCRCGASQNKPFCDGSHLKIGFKG